MSSLVDALLIVQSILVFLLAGYEYLTLMHFPALPEISNSPPKNLMVSIVLPVRDQANTVSECVASLVGLDYPEKEIIVVDGNSTDGTQDILKRFNGKIKLVEEESLPQGWVGKNWACHSGYKQATGDLLMFTDGDSIHARDSLAKTVSYLEATKADLVTLAPAAILRTFWEKLLQPPIFWLIMMFVGGKWVNDDLKPRWALGNGQYMLFRREAYDKVGGHDAVRDRISEDYSLGRLIKAKGLRLRIVTASDSLAVRMYSSLPEIWRGWRKNFYSVSGNHPLFRAAYRLLLLFTFLVLPFIVLGYGVYLAPSQPLNAYLLTGGFMAFFLWLGIIILDRSIGVSPLYALLLPFAVLFYIGIGVDSTVRGALGMGFSWKGRVYGKPITGQLKPTAA
ncbi:MAG TPA: glycosyltransferase [Candidatus Bathyarchaeia archaeon]|nr:glycosyltransferase [Candidatus Bathyarchaeia archaeon]